MPLVARAVTKWIAGMFNWGERHREHGVGIGYDHNVNHVIWQRLSKAQQAQGFSAFTKVTTLRSDFKFLTPILIKKISLES